MGPIVILILQPSRIPPRVQRAPISSLLLCVFSSCNDNAWKCSYFKRAQRPGRFVLQQIPGQDQESKRIVDGGSWISSAHSYDPIFKFKQASLVRQEHPKVTRNVNLHVPHSRRQNRKYNRFASFIRVLPAVQYEEQSEQGGTPAATLSKRSAFLRQTPTTRTHVCSAAATAAPSESVSPSPTSSIPEQSPSPFSPFRLRAFPHCCLAPVYWPSASLDTQHHDRRCHCCCCFCNEAIQVLESAPLSAPTTMSRLGRPVRATSPHYRAPCAERGS